MNSLQRMGSAERRSQGERRKSERLDARFAAVRVASGDGVGSALCGDLSRSGARLSLDRPLAVGEVLSVGFGSDVSLTGRVAWVDGAECGIEFDSAVEGQVPAGVSATGDRRQRPLVLLDGTPRFQEGLSVTVMLPDCERKAVLRWTKDNVASFTMQP